MANLTGQNIKDTYQQLVTLGSGTTITNGTGSQITDLAVTASWASNAVTASYALNAGVTVDTGSLMVTGSVSGNVLTFTKGNGSAFNLTVDTGSGAGAGFPYTGSAGILGSLEVTGNATVTATSSLNRVQAVGSEIFVDDKLVITSGDLNVEAGNVLVSVGDVTVLTGSLVANTLQGYITNPLLISAAGGVNINSGIAMTVTASAVNLTGGLNVTGGITGSIASASYASNAGLLNGQPAGFYATTAELTSASASLSGRVTALEGEVDSLQAATSSYASAASVTSLSSSLSTSITNLSSSLSTRLTADESNTSANTAAISSLTAATSSYAKTNVNNTFTGTQTFNNITVNGTGSFAYIQSVTGSAKIIGDAFIILNNDTPAERYAGIIVQDSGSTLTTASFQFDGQTNDWFYEYSDDGGATVDHGVALFGPEYNTKGSPTYPTANQIQKGTGTHHLTGSALSDDGTKVTVATSLESIGNINSLASIIASTGFSGSLNGNADTATSASYATTASYVSGQSPTIAGDLQFSSILGEIYGSATSPVTGNLTISATSTKRDGSVALIFHTGSSEPTISGGTIVKKTGLYSSTELNVITLTNVDGTNYVESIAGAGITSVASASYATYADTAGTATSASYAPHIQGLIQGNPGEGGTLRSFIIGGASSIASGSDSVSIGNAATASGYQSVALGAAANAPDFAATAIGGASKAEASSAVAIGNGATIRSQGGIGVGASSEAEGGQYAIAIGQTAKAYGNNTIAIGGGATTAYPLDGQIVIGRSTSTGANEIIIGSGSTSYGANTVHIGNASTTDTYLDGIIHGNGASITGVVSSSYALTASYAVSTADIFPYTGDAVISGSLTVRGGENVNLIASSSTTNVFGAGPVIGGYGGTTYFVSRPSSVGASGNMKVEAGRDLNIDVDTQYHLITHKNSTSGDTYWTDNGTSDFQIRGNSVSRSGSLWWKPSTAGQAGVKLEKIPTQVQFADWSQNTSDWVNWLTIPANSTVNPNPSVQFKRSVEVTGSLNVSGGITGSLLGTATSASFASNAGLVQGTGTNSLRSAPFLTSTPATASGIGAIAIGEQAEALADYSIAIGFNTEVFDTSRTESIAIGRDARTAQYSVSIGAQSDAVGAWSTALGYQANASNNYSLALGYNAQGQATGGVAIGSLTNLSGDYSLAVGYDANATAAGAIAIGSGSNASGVRHLAIGSAASATGATAMDIRVNGSSIMTATTASQAVTFPGGITGSLSGTASLATEVYNNNTSSGSLGFWQGSQTEYNAISGSASNSIIYFII